MAPHVRAEAAEPCLHLVRDEHSAGVVDNLHHFRQVADWNSGQPFAGERRANQQSGELDAIALEIEKVQTPRPMTHDLLKNVLTGLNVHVQKVVVSDLKDDTFYALIWMERDGQLMSMDSRPSDALALALRLDCPIFVEDEVLKNSRTASAISEKSSNEELRKWLENLNDEDLGRYKM